MKSKIVFIIAAIGILAGILSAYIYGRQKPPQPAAFKPAQNPYEKGIYANGIIESHQSNGVNINIYPEVSGTVSRIIASEGAIVKKGDVLLRIDDSVQRSLAEQQKAQSDAALALLEKLRAQPRQEDLAVAKAQTESLSAALKGIQDQFGKLQRAFELDARSVSRDALDNSENAVKTARANLQVAQRQYELIKAGAWSYDIRNQENQYNALTRSYAASKALLEKYTLRAASDGIVLAINAAVGSYVSPQGVYDSYTRGTNPVIVMGAPQDFFEVRCYVDEILISRLPEGAKMKAKMFIRGTNKSLPLEYIRMQPYVTPKIQLSNQRLERVDVRVLPVIFRVERPKDIALYPGQLVDVYIAEQ